MISPNLDRYSEAKQVRQAGYKVKYEPSKRTIESKVDLISSPPTWVTSEDYKRLSPHFQKALVDAYKLWTDLDVVRDIVRLFNAYTDYSMGRRKPIDVIPEEAMLISKSGKYNLVAVETGEYQILYERAKVKVSKSAKVKVGGYDKHHIKATNQICAQFRIKYYCFIHDNELYAIWQSNYKDKLLIKPILAIDDVVVMM